MRLQGAVQIGRIAQASAKVDEAVNIISELPAAITGIRELHDRLKGAFEEFWKTYKTKGDE